MLAPRASGPASLWAEARTRGPAEAPCSSGQASVPSARRRSWTRAPRGAVVVALCATETAASRLAAASFACPSSRSSTRHRQRRRTAASLGLEGGASDLGDPQGSHAAPSGRRVTISYEEANADDIFVPAPPGRTLKINVDLLLWRCRQARLKAQLQLDGEERRELMREAEAGLRRCLALDPSDPRTYVVLGKTLMVQRRFDEVRALYAEGVTNTGNSNPYIWSAWGWLEYKTGNVARARQLFDAAVVVDDTHACAWHKWGLLEKSEGNYLKARDLWMQGIRRCKRKPQSQNAYLFNALAVMAAELQRVSEARAWFDEGTSTTEGAASVALWQAWAVLEARQGDPTAVRYLFKKALGANPKSRYVHLAWALWERQAGNMLACMELLERGTAHNPTDAALYQARALVEWRDFNRPDKAREVFQEGIRADPGHLPLWQAWGCMEAQLGKVERARELFQQGVWADPRSRDTVWVFHAWGCLERGQGNLQLARELFKAAIKVDPKADKVWFTWIAMETDAGFAERADELRIRQAEQQWEFEVPAGFTTRPGGLGTPSATAAAQQQQQGVAAAAAASGVSDAVAAALSPLNALRDQLTRFFTARAGKPPGSGAAARPSPQSSGSAQPFLPADFTGDLSVEDALRDQQLASPLAASSPPRASMAMRGAATAVDRAASALLRPVAVQASAPAAGTSSSAAAAPLQPSLLEPHAAGEGQQGAGGPVFSAALGADDDGEHGVQVPVAHAAMGNSSSSSTGAAHKGSSSSNRRRGAQSGRGAGRSTHSPAPPASRAKQRPQPAAAAAAAAGSAQVGKSGPNGAQARKAGYTGGGSRAAGSNTSAPAPTLVAKPARPAGASSLEEGQEQQQDQQQQHVTAEALGADAAAGADGQTLVGGSREAAAHAMATALR